MENLQDKRQEARIDLAVPVTFENGSGLSRDISRSGIYFLTDQPIVPGISLNFSIELDYIRPGKPVQLDCQGQVLRVEPVGQQLGVAASISEFWCLH